MKTLINLRDRIVLALRYIKEGDKAHGVMERCPNCGSTNISLLDRKERIANKELQYEYKGRYLCNRCGAEALANEAWDKGSDRFPEIVEDDIGKWRDIKSAEQAKENA